jgi:hypothetical protein
MNFCPRFQNRDLHRSDKDLSARIPDLEHLTDLRDIKNKMQVPFD